MHQKEQESQYMSMTLKNSKNQKNNNLSPSNLSSKNRMMMTRSSIMVRNQKKLILDLKKAKLKSFINHNSKNNKKNPKSNLHKNNQFQQSSHNFFNMLAMLLTFQKQNLLSKTKFSILNFIRKIFN